MWVCLQKLELILRHCIQIQNCGPVQEELGRVEESYRGSLYLHFYSICVDYLTLKLHQEVGVEVGNGKVNALAFADDLILLASTRVLTTQSVLFDTKC